MASNKIPTPQDPTEDEALALFKAIEEKFPSESLGEDKWYLVLVGRPNGDIAPGNLTGHSWQPWSAVMNPNLHHFSTKSSSSDLNTPPQINDKR
jgi:hypothetical protein